MSHIIGIDLGTTNSTLAYSAEESLKISQFEIMQRINASMESAKTSFPSFCLFPLEKGIEPFLGWYAKERGSELPDRVIASAKSWLCHDLIDRRSPFLPLSDCEHKRSPLDVCSSFLNYLRLSWGKAFAHLPFEQQKVLVTVPASFDPSARELVLEAAKLAAYPEVRLIEEPLAAFYAWLYSYQENWRDHLKVGDTVLVIDIGGGTTDFSLIAVEDLQGNLALERKAVGDHLLLGGDNIDLALAHFVQPKFATALDEWQFQSLIHSCRSAKEQLLSENSPDSIQISVQGRGSSIVGNTLTADLSKEEVEKVLVEGFFPTLPFSESISQHQRSGLAKVSLPYARDPRITAQLAHFLKRSGSPLPSAVLFNGGTMKASAFQTRILHLLSEWRGEPVKNLPGAELDFGVSRGAVYYGWALAKGGIRVKAATARSYFIGIESSLPAIPGVAAPIKKIPIVPFGMEEGSEKTLEGQQFSLFLNEPAIFRFFSQNSPASEELTELHPIETQLHNSKNEEETVVLVKLTAKVTELGVLELWCVAEDGRKWKLEFDTRKMA